MNGARQHLHGEAEKCLVAVCAHLALTVVRDENFPLWLAALAEVLPHCDRCPDALVALRVSADDLVAAAPGRARDRALMRVGVEVRAYYRVAAAGRLDAWRRVAAGGVAA